MAKTKLKRGGVYFVNRTITIGCEMMGGRPAIIVSNDEGNRAAEIVEVVYLTTALKSELPTHVKISSTERPSTALCEQITTVSKNRLGLYIGSATAQEMEEIDKALKISLGLQ